MKTKMKIKNLLKRSSKVSKAKERFLEIIDLPTYLQKDVTRLTAVNNTNVYIEQYDSVVDYYSHYIKIRTDSVYIIVEGKQLNIDEINKEELIIKGIIDSISYKSR